jgi:hypothetical protein
MAVGDPLRYEGVGLTGAGGGGGDIIFVVIVAEVVERF